ncbi:MAG: hypothetical protein Q4D23_11775 [Bacteroidales bacterium]|nr:hypothetical protein [Bacteroidales bacterium]
MKKLLFVAAAVVAMSSASTMFTSCKKNIVDTDPKTVITDSTAGDSLNPDSANADAKDAEATDDAKPEAGTDATTDKAPAADAAETPAEPAK